MSYIILVLIRTVCKVLENIYTCTCCITQGTCTMSCTCTCIHVNDDVSNSTLEREYIIF